MKSIQVVEFGQPLVQQDVSLPEVSQTQVLLQVLAAGVCHTDLHLWQGTYDLDYGRRLSKKTQEVSLPLTLGHETVGKVVAVGSAVENTQVGDTCLIYPWVGCGHCDACQAGQENYCLQPATLGINQPGGYAEYIRVPDEKYLIPIPGLSPEKAAPLACTGLTCYSALRKFDLARLRRTPLIVIGAGSLGLMTISLLTAMGGKAIAIEPNEKHRTAALAVGAVAAFDSTEPDVIAQVQRYVGSAIYEVIDFVANTSTAELAFDLLARGGKLVLVGLYGGDAPWPLHLIATKALTIQGSFVGSLRELRELVNLVTRHEINLIPITTCGLHEVQRVFNDLEAGDVIGQVVIVPEA